MKILITGSRDHNDLRLIEKEILNEIGNYQDEVFIIHGAAKGADTIADTLAKAYGWTLMIFPANWKRFGAAAGPRRNELMLDTAKPDVVLAFPLSNSKGTHHCVNAALKRNIRVKVIISPQMDG